MVSTGSPRGVAEVVEAYFEAVAARDAPGLRAVFAPDAVLQDPMGTRRGPEAIVQGYEDRFFESADFAPQPGPVLIENDRAAVEISLHLGGEVVRLADFFTITGGKITRLDIYRG